MRLTDRRLELVSAVVLSSAALASSWASYQGSLWDGEQAAAYSRANVLRIQATDARREGDARQADQRAMFIEWLNAIADRDETRAGFYRERFPEEFRPAFNAWLRDRPRANPSATPTPFLAREYDPPGHAAAAALDAKAEATFAEGERANTISDAFGQSATILASALFFGGILQVFDSRSVKAGLLLVAALAALFGVLRMAGLPVQVLGLAPLGYR
ncbi:MAG: hypothetical protein ABW042_12075 [Phenylobacterium sp.]